MFIKRLQVSTRLLSLLGDERAERECKLDGMIRTSAAEALSLNDHNTVFGVQAQHLVQLPPHVHQMCAALISLKARMRTSAPESHIFKISYGGGDKI